jgi:glycosyltransferase involved in cell wall biosynthesis
LSIGQREPRDCSAIKSIPSRPRAPQVILVNDGSTDDTWEVAQRLTQRFFHSRVRVITKPNGGLADARNVGLRYAKVRL